MDYVLLFPFIADKVGKTGISVSVTVRDLDAGTVVVNAQPATEVGDGVYKYVWQNNNPINALATATTADTTVDQQVVHSFISKEQMMIYGELLFSTTIMGGLLGSTIPGLVDGSTKVTAIKAKTDNLPSSPAASGEYNTTLNAIKTKTDTITTPPTAGAIADAVWDEAISGHTTSGTFGAKNQKAVPSETLADYKADVSGLALETTAQAIKAKTDTITTPPTVSEIANAVWTRTTRTITTTIPTAANIASSVWSNATRTLTSTFPTPPTPAQIATAVWAETVRTLTSHPTQLTQADIRQAVGLIAANLDSQLAGLGTKIDDLPAPDNTSIAGIKAKTDQLSFTGGKVDANATIDASGLATEATLNAVKAKTDQLTFVNNKVDANATATVDTTGLALETTQQGILSMLSSDPLPVRIDGIVGSTITATRGNDWFIAIEGLTLDGKIQLAIKRNDNQPDDLSALFVDSVTGLITLNGKPATDPTLASLTYSGGILTLSVDASITAQLLAVSYRYGVQSVQSVGGTVSEKYGGEFVVNADIVRATE